MKNRKILFLILTLILIFAFTGCSKKTEEVPDVVEPVNTTDTVKDNTTPDDDSTVTPEPADTVNENNTSDPADPDVVTDNSGDEGNFSLMNFIGCWKSETDPMILVIDSDYNWQACTDDEIFCTGYLEPDYGFVCLYKTVDDTYYCTLEYNDMAVMDEFGNIYYFDGPVEEHVPSGKVDTTFDSVLTSYSLPLGKYYDEENEGEYIEISEGLNYEMYCFVDGRLELIDCGYLEKKDDIGNYTVYPTMYIDEESYEIFEFDTGVLSWNGFIYTYSDEDYSEG